MKVKNPTIVFVESKYNRSNMESEKLAINCIATFCEENEINLKQSLLIIKDSWGKPHCNIPGIYLSISYCKDYWICAVSISPVGVDIEKKDVELKPAFLKMLKNSIENQYSALLLWTKIESCSKIIGKGLTTKLEKLIDCVMNGMFRFADCSIDTGYICTLCFCSDSIIACEYIRIIVLT